MKIRKMILAGLVGLAAIACQTPAGGQEGVSKEAKALLPSKAATDSVSYLLGVNFGSMLKGTNFGDINYKEMEKGMDDFLNSKGNPYEESFGEQFKINPNDMNVIINAYLEKMNAYAAAVNTEKENKFFDENKKKANVKETESGLQYEVIVEGDMSKKANSPADTVTVRYKGSLLDGTVFDEVGPEMDPIDLTLDRVIPGWTEGLQLVGEGGLIKLYIPSRLGYGERGTQGIEPNSTLVFDVEVVSVKPFAE